MIAKRILFVVVLIGMLVLSTSYICPPRPCADGLRDDCYKNGPHTTYRMCVNATEPCGQRWRPYCERKGARHYIYVKTRSPQCICECCNRDRLSSECWDVDDKYTP
uniref:Uncharacterized protein n=1 Tax=Rhipicephalus zambeziensis TaxID=60191 RepID=A0A224YFR4_9ACAR